MSAPNVKFCVRCETPFAPLAPRFFRGIIQNGVWVAILEFFCEGCFAIWNPTAAGRLAE